MPYKVARQDRLLAPAVVVACLLPACGWRELPDRCPAGDGLATAGYDGSTLPAQTAALTFDGGPNGATRAIGDVLSVAGVAGTFFVDGSAVDGSEGVLDALVEQGHLIGQRGWSGDPLETSPDVVTEVRRTDAEMAPWVSGEMYLLRPAGGELSAGTLSRLESAGLGRYVGPIAWDIGPGAGLAADDETCELAGTTAPLCAQALAAEVRAKGRAIVSLRGDAPYAADVTRALVDDLKQSEYKTARVDGIGDVARALVLTGAQPEALGGDQGCDEY
jgi:peptidoglycan/xylan/chitin deacetylase (PgdA/CDA1 family)